MSLCCKTHNGRNLRTNDYVREDMSQYGFSVSIFRKYGQMAVVTEKIVDNIGPWDRTINLT